MKLLSDLSNYMDLDILDLISNYLTAPRKYKEFEINKKNGGKRKIAQPSKELKEYQYAIVDSLINKFPIHECATAYCYNKSIYNNALPHKNSSWVLKLDFKDFFHSIRPEHFSYYINRQYENVSQIEVDILNHYLFWLDSSDKKLKLSIGAPSSPMLSNIIMYEFDKKVADICSDFCTIYTRYADDITLSADSRDDLLRVEVKLQELIDETQVPLLILNESKRVLIGKNKSKRVTGVVITHENKLSVGRYKRKKVRAMLYRYSNNILDSKDIPLLHGTLSYINLVENEYYNKLINQYGEALFNKLARQSFKISKVKIQN